jgi:hypothetical protein
MTAPADQRAVNATIFLNLRFARLWVRGVVQIRHAAPEDAINRTLSADSQHPLSQWVHEVSQGERLVHRADRE